VARKQDLQHGRTQLSVRSAKARDLARRLARRNIGPSPMSWNARSKLMKFARRGASRHPFFTRALRTTMAPTSIWRPSFAKTGRSIRDRSFDLPRHQRHLGNAAQTPNRCDHLARAQALLTVTMPRSPSVSENSPRREAARLEQAWPRGVTVLPTGFSPSRKPPHSFTATLWAQRFRQGRPMTAPDGMIAAIARINGGRLATRTSRTSKRQASNSSLRGFLRQRSGPSQ